MRTPLSLFVYGDVHELHVYCGYTILYMSLIHTVFHLARWYEQGNLNLVYQHMSGITGLIIITSCLLICIPMTLFREKIKYEIRKRLHYLFIVFAIALCFHTPVSAIPNGGFTAYVFGTVIVWYIVDATICYLFMTEKLDTTNFHVLPTGVRMTMNVSKRFQKMGAHRGYVHVSLPWVDRNQWHAFSLFENPENPEQREIFMMKLGDWTSQVHTMLQRDTVRPAWITGPFPSPYNSAADYDNQILVASGIGITPALSVIRAHRESRRINLIWAVRDKYLLEFFLKHMYLDHHGWNLIFYTGKETLGVDSHINIVTNTNVCIIEGRPNLHEVIPNIIYGIESGVGLPERYVPDGKMVASEMLLDMLNRDVNESSLSSNSSNGSSSNGSSSKKKGRRNKNNKNNAISNDDSLDMSDIGRSQAEHLAHCAAELGFHLPVDAISQEFSFHSSTNETNIIDDSWNTVLSSSSSPAGGDTKRSDFAKRRQSSEFIFDNLALGFCPWDKQDGAKEYVKNLDQNLVLRTWGVLYCGGAKKLEKDLRKVTDNYGLQIHVESFAW